MEFKVLSSQDCEEVRLWRNEVPEALRTPYMLTEEQQEGFYDNVICDRNAKAKYWGVWEENKFIGMTGIENIEWENRRGEISLILSPEYRGNGNGAIALDILLHKGFNELNLQNIWGVCYECNFKASTFWEREIVKRGLYYTMLPNMKYWRGKYWRGLYFNFERSKNEPDNT